MLKVSFLGLGKMGSVAAQVAAEDSEINIISGIELIPKKREFPVYTPDKIKEAVKDSEIVVDFTTPEAASEHIPNIIALGKKVVTGTTGFNSEQIKKIQDAVIKHNAVVLMAPNFSVGVNLFFKFAGEMASKLKEYDVELIEWHHNQKKDAPSGTAIKTAKILQSAREQNDELVYGRNGAVPRKKNEIGIHAVRAGDIVGIHSIWFVGNNEEIELRHSAHSRHAFARGCLQAIKWIGKQNKGGKLYSMNDVLEI